MMSTAELSLSANGLSFLLASTFEHPMDQADSGLCYAPRFFCRAADERDDLAPFQLMELHSVPASVALHDIDWLGLVSGWDDQKRSEVQSVSIVTLVQRRA